MQVYERLRPPLVTLMTVPSFEIMYGVLSHVKLLVRACPGVFDQEYKNFFCRFNEPTCVKELKMDILPLLANEENVVEIVAELR